MQRVQRGRCFSCLGSGVEELLYVSDGIKLEVGSTAAARAMEFQKIIHQLKVSIELKIINTHNGP